MTDDRESVLLQAPCGIFSFSTGGLITMANGYCCKILEYESGELDGLNISAMLTISGRIFYQTHFYPLIKLHKHAEEIFLLLQTKTQQDIPVVLNAIETELHGSTLITCSFIPVFNRRRYEDEIISAKKKAEDALHENKALEKIKQELEIQTKELDRQVTLLKFQNNELLKLGDVITHDLQEPVRKLILFSDELGKEDKDEKFFRRGIEVIKKSSHKIKSLILNLQDYLGLTVPLSTNETVQLDKLLRNELQQLEKIYPQIKLQAAIDQLPIITGDGKQLGFMFHHLLRNAFEHGASGDVLSLSIEAVLTKENFYLSLEHQYKYITYVRITIRDEGPGFDPDYNEYVFNVLKKLNLDRESLGFGLAFCKRIAENHFGSIKAQGVKGKGASFTVMLPVDSVL